MLKHLPEVQKNQKAITISQLSLAEGIEEKKIARYLKKFEIDTRIMQSAISLTSEMDGQLNSVCALLKEHDGNVETVREIYEIRNALEEVSLIKISKLIKRFEGSEIDVIIETIQEAHKISRRRFVGSTLDDLLKLASSNDQIFWLDHLLEAYLEERGLKENDEEDES